MTNRRRLITILACFASAACAANAQIRNSDAFLGYSRSGTDLFYPNTGGLNGVDAALHIHMMPFLGIEGDVGYYGLGTGATMPKSTTFMAGPRATVKAPAGIRLFVHGLVGGEHSTSSGGVSISGSSFIYDIGGGIDFRIFPFFAWRFGGDRIGSPTLSPTTSSKDRFNTGLVFRF